MSLNATLMDYEVDIDGNIFEPGAKVVESAFISPELIEVLREKELLETRILFEEHGSPDTLDMECIKPDSIDELINVLEMELIKILSSEEACSIKEVLTKGDMELLMQELRTVTNLFHLAKLKRDNFSSRPGSLIKIG